MACNNCSSEGGTPKGCKNNGTCGTDSCNKMSVFNWLSNMQGVKEVPYVEVRFKNDRKEFFFNENKIPLNIGDTVAVQATSGHDVGVVSLTGELVELQMKRKKVKTTDELHIIYRKANERDIETFENCRKKEEEIKIESRKIASHLRLRMKISDVEFQGDGTKATFYYTASGRVDFRQLIKDLASTFRIRIEMRQIGQRQEAAKVGGIGSCGRELCCSTWLTDFRTVSTSAARYQQLSINPQKIAGQCGKLKCCLNYELDSYMDALKQFPSTNTTLKTKDGDAVCVKIDVFKKQMWFQYKKQDSIKWFVFDVDSVKEFITENKKGNLIEGLGELETPDTFEVKKPKDLISQDDLTRFDRPKRKKGKPRRKSNRGGNNPANKNNSSKGNQKNQGNNSNKGNKQSTQANRQKGSQNNNPQGNKNRNKKRNNRPSPGSSNKS